MAAKTYSVPWSYKLRTNGKPTSIREAVADLLRRRAFKIDNRLTVTFDLQTSPDIGLSRKAECIAKGIAHTKRLLESEAKEAAITKAMRDCMPELFEDA